jgi:hypothetical protein
MNDPVKVSAQGSGIEIDASLTSTSFSGAFTATAPAEVTAELAGLESVITTTDPNLETGAFVTAVYAAGQFGAAAHDLAPVIAERVQTTTLIPPNAAAIDALSRIGCGDATVVHYLVTYAGDEATLATLGVHAVTVAGQLVDTPQGADYLSRAAQSLSGPVGEAAFAALETASRRVNSLAADRAQTGRLGGAEVGAGWPVGHI